MYAKEDISRMLNINVALTYIDKMLDSIFSECEKWLATAKKSHILQKMVWTSKSFRFSQLATAWFATIDLREVKRLARPSQ